MVFSPHNLGIQLREKAALGYATSYVTPCGQCHKLGTFTTEHMPSFLLSSPTNQRWRQGNLRHFPTLREGEAGTTERCRKAGRSLEKTEGSITIKDGTLVTQ